MHALASELTGVWQGRWNAKIFNIFHMVILKRAQHVTRSGVIQRRIDCHLDAWEAGEFEMLVEDMARTFA